MTASHRFATGRHPAPPRRRARTALAAAAALAVLFAAPVPGPAGADSPDDTGWWSRAQTPSTPPGIAPPPTIPAPPPEVVPEDGLFVAMGPYSDVPDPAQPPPPVAPIAIAALRFTVPEGASGTLSLALAPNYDADGPNQQNHPPFLVDACVPDTNAIPWDPPAGANGRWEDRPVPDCDSFSIGSTVEEDGQRLSWELPSQFQSPEGIFDVILVPRGIPDPSDPAKTVAVPFALAFEPPDDQALLVEGGDLGGDEFGAEEGDFDFAVDGDFGLEDDFGFTDDFGFETDFGEDLAVGGATGTGTAGRPNRFQPTAGVPAIDDRVERVIAVAVLLALLIALWWIAGEPVRPPRLLGSVGAGSAAATATDGRRGGVGRFERIRAGRPPRLS